MSGRPIRPRRREFLILAAGALALRSRGALAFDADVTRVLAPTGRLRAGLYQGTPTSILSKADPDPRGVGYEVGRELARQLGVPFEPVVFARNAEVQQAIRSGTVDVAFTNATAARAKNMDFGPPYLEIDLGYLVPPDSAIRRIDDVDASGRRIGVTTGSTSDATLSAELKAATIVRATTFRDAVALLTTQQIDAFATNKATLFELAEQLPGSQVLDGRWGIERHAIGIPKGRDAGLDALRRFTSDIVASGLIRDAAARAGLKGADVR